MRRIWFIFLLLIPIVVLANNAPLVEDITFIQRDDGSHIVDIYFNLVDQDGDLLTVSIFASNDAGETWDFPMSTYTGDFGEDISTGSNKQIIWDFAADHPDIWEPNMQFKITVSDGYYEPGENWCYVAAGTYTWGQNDVIQTIDYDYEIMKYKVTNIRYLEYLEEAYAAGDVWIQSGDVYGYYAGDEHYGAGNYALYDLGSPSSSYNYARISYDGSSFIINVPSGYNVGDFDDHPVIEVSWFGSNAYALHYGWRLPTEQEWEKAARGMTGYEYPWGDVISGDRANYYSSGDPWDNGTTPVGYYNGENGTIDSPSPYGCYDMCGNVCDWTDSWYGSYSYRVLRGGSWFGNYSYIGLRSWFRYYIYPTNTNYYIGFRCARTVR
ncbi:MAG: SUMF1/EgtB/PvdO family nonheme iron enzyme [Candidatus Stygibacter frigidus]|nr:SUMF1/EgtB/PvdO family nonheme iron enzyme [Candidatus Stygibacter frigidus]